MLRTSRLVLVLDPSRTVCGGTTSQCQSVHSGNRVWSAESQRFRVDIAKMRYILKSRYMEPSNTDPNHQEEACQQQH
jgi:hypothetical protein